jgi:acyl phosphate:glycerol-3-phosphate acyltransferase
MLWYAAHVGSPLLLGYLLGSIPFGLLLTRAAGLGDIRSIGSGNIGATNVLRTGRRGLAAATLLLDALKGLAAVIIAGAVLGHMFPVWLSFKGGKGVATTLGVMWGLAWPIGAVACAVWLLMAALLRYSSLAALVGVVAGAIAAWLVVDARTAIVVTLIVPLVWIRHHENIRRLLAGTESKIGQKVGSSEMGHNGGPSLS